MLELKNVSKKFKNGSGITDVSFKVHEGEIVGFVGENGAGKTTTIKCIFNEFKKDSGSILYNGQSLTNSSILQRLSFFPDANNVPLDLTVIDLMNYIGNLIGLKQDVINNRTNELIKTFNLEQHKFKKLKELSAGLKKRAMMAYCLISKPELLILDEPTANLDITYRWDFIKLFEELTKLGIPILITSHDFNELQNIINHLIIIKNGEIIYDEKFNNSKDNIVEIYERTSKTKDISLSFIKDMYNE